MSTGSVVHFVFARFEYPISVQEVSKRQLEVTVKNDTGMFSSSQTFMGMVIVDLQTLDTSKAVTEW